jgi:hypothetical protein
MTSPHKISHKSFGRGINSLYSGLRFDVIEKPVPVACTCPHIKDAGGRRHYLYEPILKEKRIIDRVTASTQAPVIESLELFSHPGDTPLCTWYKSGTAKHTAVPSPD